MKWIQKTVVFIGFSIALLFAFNANAISLDSIQTEKSHSFFSADSIHSSAFIQPQVHPVFALHDRSIDPNVSNFYENYLVAVPNFKASKYIIHFAKQDINRCEMVSLLLFPFHFFW